MKLRQFIYLMLVTVSFNIPVLSEASETKNFKVKGFHLDLRIQVMKLQALKDLAVTLSNNGINTLIMEYEATFPYRDHRVISNRYAYSRAEISDFVNYCQTLNIDVIPLQQTFGHLEYILQNQRYADLRESQIDYSQINPLKVGEAHELFENLLGDMASVHKSRYIHIGCDETRLLGVSAEGKLKLAAEGPGKLYGEYVAMVCDIVLKMGKIPVLWADMILKYPEAMKYLPDSAIIVDWNYGWSLDRFGDPNLLSKYSNTVWGAPSLRSSPDNYNLTSWSKHFNNLKDFIPQARTLKYKGIIMTSWSTSGVYSYVWDNPDIISLEPIRRVYPITGFQILLSAFFDAANSEAPLDIANFVADYALKNYGLEKEEAEIFFNAIKMTPYMIKDGKPLDTKITLTQMIDSTELALQTLIRLDKKVQTKEFKHYVLMAKIRLNYLEFAELETRMNSPSYNKHNSVESLKHLNKLIKEEKKIDQEYINLNRNYFYVSELKKDNEMRSKKMIAFQEKLKTRK